MDTSELSNSQHLQSRLWYERCLNQLSDRLSACVTAFLASGNDVPEDRDLRVEAAIFKAFVQEVSIALQSSSVIVALSNTAENDCEPTFTVRASASADNQRSLVTSWTLPSGACIQLNVGQTLNQQDLQFLHAQYPNDVWQLLNRQQCIGWLLVCPNSTLSCTGDSELLSIKSDFTKQAVYRCTAALEQISLLQIQRQHYRTLLAKNQELEQTNQLKSEFLANTSHEIRTPLSSILGFTHLLQQQGFNPINLRHQEYLKIILTSGQHLLALINDILDLSKIEANQLTLERETVEVEEICQVALTLVREKASDKGLKLQLELDSTIKTLLADGLRLKQMLFNLLSNAIKFTIHGSVGLQVVPSDGFLRFTVWDTGTGISKEQQALLFQPYSQIANQAAVRGEGTGLGLLLTQKLAELHSGWIEVTSEPNRGSRFTVVLPANSKNQHSKILQEPSPATVPAASDTVQELDRANSVPPSTSDSDPETKSRSGVAEIAISSCPNRILLVEDNVHNAKLMLTYLSRLGYEVSWAKDGKEMWRALERSLPAIILMDVQLPDIDGLTLVRQLKSNPCHQDIPIIAQTAMAMKGDRSICLAAGAEDYISKPIDLDALAQLVAKYVSVDAKA